MNVTCLPSEIILKICSYLDWRTLNVAKRTCNKFHGVIFNNATTLDKPKTKEIDVKYYIDANGMRKIKLKFAIYKKGENDDNSYFISSTYKEFTLPIIEVFDYFLKLLDLSMLKKITFDVGHSTDIVRTFNNYYKGKVTLISLALNSTGPLSENSRAIDVINLLKRVKDVVHLDLKLKFPNGNSLDRIVLPSFKELAYLNIEESEGTRLVDISMMARLLGDCCTVMMCTLSINDPGSYTEIVDKLVYRKDLHEVDSDNEILQKNEKQTCKHRFLKLYLNVKTFISSEDNDLIESMFKRNRFHVESNWGLNADSVDYRGMGHCPSCSSESHITVSIGVDE